MVSTTRCTGWEGYRRKISRGFFSNAMRFFIFGVHCARPRLRDSLESGR